MGKRFELAPWELGVLKAEARRRAPSVAEHNALMEAECLQLHNKKDEHEKRVLEWTPEECSQWLYEQQKELDCDACIPGIGSAGSQEEYLDELLRLLEEGKLDHVRRAIKEELY